MEILMLTTGLGCHDRIIMILPSESRLGVQPRVQRHRLDDSKISIKDSRHKALAETKQASESSHGNGKNGSKVVNTNPVN